MLDIESVGEKSMSIVRWTIEVRRTQLQRTESVMEMRCEKKIPLKQLTDDDRQRKEKQHATGRKWKRHRRRICMYTRRYVGKGEQCPQNVLFVGSDKGHTGAQVHLLLLTRRFESLGDRRLSLKHNSINDRD
ncbi:hypothetical protein DINM_004923 [Dirofilaria immitis]|nr:hypothetical protein [Dirofilaria immitis]